MTESAPRASSPHIFGVSGLIMLGIVPIALAWMTQREPLGAVILVLCLVSVLLWMLVLWWSLYHILFHILALCQTDQVWQACNKSDVALRTRFAVLYLTCDDLVLPCFHSCVHQVYPGSLFKVVICDDSELDSSQVTIDKLVALHKNVELSRRNERTNFKAGNLNHAFDRCVRRTEPNSEGWDWIVIVDSDQYLPRDYLVTLSQAVSGQPDVVAFVQGSSDAAHLAPQIAGSDYRPTVFQERLGYDVRVFFEREMKVRELCGFLPFLGHGGAIRCSAWEELKGFPGVVSEDFAFAMRARDRGLLGKWVESVRSAEAYPQDFDAFVTRICKFAGGAAELYFQGTIGEFVRGKASHVEKVDLVMTLAVYPLMVGVVINGFLSTYLCHYMWQNYIPMVHPWLGHIFVGLLLCSFPVAFSVAESLLDGIRYWFWSFCVYSAVSPVVACSFIAHTVKKPTFVRTPKGVSAPRRWRIRDAAMLLIGGLTLGLSWAWWSPFSPILASQGVAYSLFGSLRQVGGCAWYERIIRTMVYIPGMLWIWGVIWGWCWATS